jgi:hypothetical protein
LIVKLEMQLVGFVVFSWFFMLMFLVDLDLG